MVRASNYVTEKYFIANHLVCRNYLCTREVTLTLE